MLLKNFSNNFSDNIGCFQIDTILSILILKYTQKLYNFNKNSFICAAT